MYVRVLPGASPLQDSMPFPQHRSFDDGFASALTLRHLHPILWLTCSRNSGWKVSACLSCCKCWFITGLSNHYQRKWLQNDILVRQVDLTATRLLLREFNISPLPTSKPQVPTTSDHPPAPETPDPTPLNSVNTTSLPLPLNPRLCDFLWILYLNFSTLRLCHFLSSLGLGLDFLR